MRGHGFATALITLVGSHMLSRWKIIALMRNLTATLRFVNFTRAKCYIPAS